MIKWIEPVVVCGPSQAGKSLLVRMLCEANDVYSRVLTATDRDIRVDSHGVPSEHDGIDYHFLSSTDFYSRIENGGFFENAKVHGNLYGTPVKSVDDVLESGKVPLWILDPFGMAKVKEKCKEQKMVTENGIWVRDVVPVFLLPADLHIYSTRLMESNVGLWKKRFETAMNEIAFFYNSRLFDYCLNTTLTIENNVAQLEAIVRYVMFEQHKAGANLYPDDMFEGIGGKVSPAGAKSSLVGADFDLQYPWKVADLLKN